MSSRDPNAESWLEISVKLPAEYAEPVTHLFTTYGDGRVFVSQYGDWDADDVDANPNPSDHVAVFCYLKNDDTVENRKGMIDIGLRLMSELTDMEPYRERMVTADEWANQSFPTIRVADRITISPWTLEDGTPQIPQNEDVQVYLSPGLAFGTGNHPTTRICLNGIVEDCRRWQIGPAPEYWMSDADQECWLSSHLKWARTRHGVWTSTKLPFARSETTW